MTGKVMRAAVVGASTLLGKEVAGEISDSAAAAWDLQLLDEGEGVEGQLTSAGEEAVVMHTLHDGVFPGLDVVFFAGTAAQTAQYLPIALRAGASIVDLSGAAAKQEGFLVRSPWTEGSARPDLTTTGILTPHPASLMLALVAERLQRRFGKVDLRATALEPASENGSAGVDELHQQTVSLLSFQEIPKTVFDAQVAFNVQPRLGEDALTSLAQKRTRIMNDLEALLGSEGGSRVSVNLLQAPVFHAYTLSASLRLERAGSAEDVRAALRGGVVTADEDTLPSNQAATELGELLISVEPDGPEGENFWLVLAADNLRLPAKSAVQAALELVALRPGTRVQ